jgi:hypothetical protein
MEEKSEYTKLMIKNHQEFNFLKGIIKDILGIDVENNKSRIREVVNAKMIYASLLQDRGYGCSTISKTIGCNHATILHYNKNFKFYIKTDSSLRYNHNLIQEEYSSDYTTTSLLTLQEIKKELILLRIENKRLHSSVSKLQRDLGILKNQDEFGNDRMTDIFKVVRQRTRVGGEDAVLKKLNIFYNGLY